MDSSNTSAIGVSSEELVKGWEVIKASGKTTPKSFKHDFERIYQGEKLSIEDQIRVLHTLNELEMIDIDGGKIPEFSPREKRTFDTADLLVESNIPEWSYLEKKLDQETIYSSENSYEFYKAEGKSREIDLPLMVFEYAEEHFDRHGLDYNKEITGDIECITAELFDEKGVFDKKLFMENDYQNNETNLRVDGKIKLPYVLGEVYDSRTIENYLNTIRINRLETLVEDIERTYMAAEKVANKGLERGDNYLTLEEVKDKLNTRLNKNFNKEEALDWCKHNAADYYAKGDSQMAATPLVEPIANFLENGRENGRDLARYNNVTSESDMRNKRSNKGEILIDVYFDTIEDLS